MADTYHVRITVGALADIEKIFDFISRASPQGAATMMRTLLDAIDGLNILPYRYDVPRRGTVRGRQIRSMPVRPYLVRYRIDERTKAVHVLRIRHGARRHP